MLKVNGMVKKIIRVDPEVCDGCSRCVLACSFGKEEKYSQARARIRIVKIAEDGFYLPVVCKHCEKPPCMDACPFGAIKRDGKGELVTVDPKVCTGCGNCVSACPFGAVTIHPERAIAMLCDLCDGEPECVKYCVSGGVRLGTIDSLASIRRMRYGRKMSKRH